MNAPEAIAAPASAESEYAKLSRMKRLAIFLVLVGPEAAAVVLKHLDEATLENVSREIVSLGLLPESIQAEALREFAGVIQQGARGVLGGAAFAQKALELAKGDFQAASILGRVGPSGTSIDVVREIAEMEARQIFNLIKSEQPQTVAFILSYLDPAKAAEILVMLPPENREEVAERLGTIEPTSLELVGRVVRGLGRHYNGKLRPTYHRSGGVRVVADVLNRLDKEVSKGLLVRIEERNAALGAAVRKKMFNFEDLGRLAPADLQRVMREIDSSQLALAMKSASDALREKIFGAVSKRAAESLREEIQLLGPVKLRDVEAAQDGIIQVVRKLEEEGEVTLDTGGEGHVLV